MVLLMTYRLSVFQCEYYGSIAKCWVLWHLRFNQTLFVYLYIWVNHGFSCNNKSPKFSLTCLFCVINVNKVLKFDHDCSMINQVEPHRFLVVDFRLTLSAITDPLILALGKIQVYHLNFRFV